MEDKYALKSNEPQNLAIQFDPKIYKSIRTTLSNARKKAFNAINTEMVQAYWEIGR